MNCDALYQVRDLRKMHSRMFALQLPEFQVPRGAVLALLGPTGAGKSTLLRLLAGVEAPDSGSILLENAPLRADSMPLTLRRRIAMVHQRPLLLTADVRTNVEYGLRLRGDRDRSRKVADVLQCLRLDTLSTQSAQTLSGGQIQLVALARALVLEPAVLLLDEPTAHLDPVHVGLVEDTIRQWRQQHPMTILWATHNLFQARRVATHTALLWNGQMVEMCSTTQFFEQPGDPRTADFIGGRLVY